jgi:DNA-binding Lrp family transcriptional regulator
MLLDEIDKRIIQELSKGIYSYEELANQIGMSRNTVYRRIAVLEENGIIINRQKCLVNNAKLGISAIVLNIKVHELDVQGIISKLLLNKQVKLVWRAYGDYNIHLIAFCSKGDEGKIIEDLRGDLENVSTVKFRVSVVYSWEKMDLSPF